MSSDDEAANVVLAKPRGWDLACRLTSHKHAKIDSRKLWKVDVQKLWYRDRCSDFHLIQGSTNRFHSWAPSLKRRRRLSHRAAACSSVPLLAWVPVQARP